MARELSVVCIRLALPLGSVFLKRSRASSSFKTLMVSARATNASARIFDLSSHSLVFVAHPFSNSAKNFLSAARAFAVSSTSSFMSTISMPVSPISFNLASMEAASASTSSFFGGHQFIVCFDCSLLGCCCACQVCCHGVPHLLENTNDLTRLRSVVVPTRKERSHH